MAYNDLIDRTGAEDIIPEPIANAILKELPSQSNVLSMARRLPDMPSKTHRLPVLSVLPTAYFVDGDTGLKQTTSMEWDKVTLTAEELAVIVPIPQAVLDDAGYPIWEEAKPALLEALGATIDAAVITGTNKPSSWPADIIAGAVAASQTVDHSSVSGDFYDEIMGAAGTIALLEADGYDVNGILSTVQMKGELRGLRIDNGGGAGTGEPLFRRERMQDRTDYSLDGIPMQFSMNAALDNTEAHMIFGDWTKLVYSIRQDVTFKVFDTGVIQDNSGVIVHNLLQQDMVAMRVVMRLGFALPNPANLLQPTAASRYPFSVLVP